jgi:3-methyl-2-oxobutanoate hydroxymethyltransferase
MKQEGRKIAVLTAYDAAMARLLDDAGVDVILVGDSVGNVIQGQPSTLPVTMDEMMYHTKIVSRGVRNALLTADMPFMSYQASVEDAVRNAGRFVKEAGAESVKLETSEEYVDTVYAIQKAGIPVMGHIGLTPQSVLKMGGYRLQGREEGEARRMIDLAKSLEEAGAFSIVLETIPVHLAVEITKSINIPTIGIGAGPGCDGQVLVINDMLGLSPEPIPKFVKKYANVREIVESSAKKYIEEVKSGNFPTRDHSYD